MPMSNIPILAEVLRQYYGPDELQDVANLFAVGFEISSSTPQEWLSVARRLVERLADGNHHVLLETLLDQVEIRNTKAMGDPGWEGVAIHKALQPKIAELHSALGQAAAPAEIAVAKGSPFSAKSQIRELLATATTDVVIVDPYVGVGTLDCLRSVTHYIRLLTGRLATSIESGFEPAVRDFRSEGFHIDIRRADMLHDRHLAFNNRCWLVGSSLKDAGRKAFYCAEIIDMKEAVVGALEIQWSSGSPYP